MTPRAAPAERRSPVPGDDGRRRLHDLVFGRVRRARICTRDRAGQEILEVQSPRRTRLRASVPARPGPTGRTGRRRWRPTAGGSPARWRRWPRRRPRRRCRAHVAFGDGLRVLEESAVEGRYVFAPAPLTWLSARRSWLAMRTMSSDWSSGAIRNVARMVFSSAGDGCRRQFVKGVQQLRDALVDDRRGQRFLDSKW